MIGKNEGNWSAGEYPELPNEPTWLQKEIRRADVIKKRRIVCLCGSTRFKKEFEEANKRLTLLGHVVLSVGFFGHQALTEDDKKAWQTQKEDLDRLHFDKIDMADEIFVVNVHGYVGESTKREIAYAEATGKPVIYLEEYEVVQG